MSDLKNQTAFFIGWVYTENTGKRSVCIDTHTATRHQFGIKTATKPPDSNCHSVTTNVWGQLQPQLSPKRYSGFLGFPSKQETPLIHDVTGTKTNTVPVLLQTPTSHRLLSAHCPSFCRDVRYHGPVAEWKFTGYIYLIKHGKLVNQESQNPDSHSRKWTSKSAPTDRKK